MTLVMTQSAGEYESGHLAYLRSAGLGPPRATMLAALDAFAGEGRKPGHAVDLGCGVGRDALPMLDRGWRVTAVDRQAEALADLRRRAGATDRLVTVAGDFEDVQWPACDLVNASFALPLCPPERFAGLWARIRASLNPGGRFAGQLYGPGDSWAASPGITIHTRSEIEDRFAGWAIERLDEEHSDSVTPRGRPKHWHIWHAVARRPG